MKIDIFNHVIPEPYLEMIEKASAGEGARVRRLTNLWDMDARMKMLAQWPDLQQVLTLSILLPDPMLVSDDSAAFARVANDSMAAICRRWPQQFPSFAASLPLNNIKASIAEIDRAVGELGACGIQLFTNVAGRPLDDPEFLPVFEHATRAHGVAVWLHPTRPASFADYATEESSKDEGFQVLGWPYETSVTMARLVFAGVFDKLPELRLITHHCGGMIPFFSGRGETLWPQMGTRGYGEDYAEVRERLAKTPLSDYFRKFYADTVLGGSTIALRCGLDFFGADKVVFASDAPFGPEQGQLFLRETMRSIDEVGLDASEREKIYEVNATGLMQKAL